MTTPTTVATLSTARLTLRPWRVDDTPSALRIYGHPEAAGCLSPAVDRVPDLATMRVLLGQWIDDETRLRAPAGRWAVERTEDRRVIGGAVLLALPPGDEDLGIGWQFAPTEPDDEYAAEAMFALATWAFGHEVDELFTVVRPEHTHTADTVRRNGMHWVGETSKYFGLDLQVFRLRQADLDPGAPSAHRPPKHERPAGAR